MKIRDKLTNSNILSLALLFFLGGVVIGSIWEVPEQFLQLMFVAVIVLVAIDYKSRLYVGLFFILLGMILGIWKATDETEKIVQENLGEFQGQTTIVKEPEMKYEYQKIIVRVDEFPMSKKSGDKLVVFTSLKPSFEYEEVVKISCQLEKPENKYEKFNYIRYLAKDEIYQVCKSAKIEKVDCLTERCQEMSFWEKILGLANNMKYALENKINRLFPQPESAYLAGLILGGDDRLPEDVAESFRRTGTTHTVAVSGYNITVLVSILVWLAILIGLWRGQAFWFALLGIIFFVIMIGAPASATRAAIMGGLLLWAAKKGKLADSTRVILLAGSVMIWFSPFILLYDVGFQLSFLATLGIILIYGPLSRKFGVQSDFLELKSIFLVTIAAQLGVLGILIYTFESFSLVSLLANMIILPFVPFIMLGGLAVILIGFVLEPLAQILALPIWLGLHLEIGIIEWLAEAPWAIIEIKNISLWWLASYYLLIVGLVLKLRK